MKKYLKIIRISCMIVLCALLLSVVSAIPPVKESLQTELPIEESSSVPDTPDTPDTPPSPPEKEYITVDGELLDIVDISDQNYSYSEMSEDLSLLYEKYSEKMSYSCWSSSSLPSEISFIIFLA